MNKVKELKYGNTKCYLINNSVMIDTDWAGTLQSFFRCIKKENIDLKNIQYLLFTHFHPDHMGIAQNLADLGIQLVIFEEQKNYIHFFDTVFAKDRKIQFKPIKDDNIITLSCTESRSFLAEAGVFGEVIHTKSHSDDSISVILDNGTAIVGDLCPLYSVPAYNDSDLEESWNKILSYNINLIFYGHAKENRIKNISSINDIKI